MKHVGLHCVTGLPSLCHCARFWRALAANQTAVRSREGQAEDGGEADCSGVFGAWKLLKASEWLKHKELFYVADSCGDSGRFLKATNRCGHFLFQMGGRCADLCCLHMRKFCWLSPILCSHCAAHVMPFSYQSSCTCFQEIYWHFAIAEVLPLLRSNRRISFIAF